MVSILNFLIKGSSILMIVLLISMFASYFTENESKVENYLNIALRLVTFIGFIIVRELESIKENTK